MEAGNWERGTGNRERGTGRGRRALSFRASPKDESRNRDHPGRGTCHSERSAEGAREPVADRQMRNRDRPDRGPSTGQPAIPRLRRLPAGPPGMRPLFPFPVPGSPFPARGLTESFRAKRLAAPASFARRRRSYRGWRAARLTATSRPGRSARRSRGPGCTCP